MAQTSARRVAVTSLIRMEKEGRYSNLELDTAIKKYELEGAEKALYTRILYGVLERKITIDALLSRASTRPIASLDSEIRNILRVAAYQIYFLDKIPVSAACNEAVNLAGARNEGTRGYVNAVVRALTRITVSKYLAELESRIPQSPRLVSVKYSVSEDIARLLISQYGFDRASSVLSAAECCDKGVSLRVNTLKTTAEALCGKLSAERSPLSDDIVCTDTLPKSELESGEFFVQSEPSCICAAAVGAKKGQTVIDACACPGGKAFSMAMAMENDGVLIARDLHKNKLSLVDGGASRLGISIIKTEELDGRTHIAENEKSADAVLCDVPCSGLGSIGRKPEIRYKDTEPFKALPEIQYAILSNNASYVKDGGVLVYSTCTLNKEENEGVTLRFLKLFPDFESVQPDYSDKFETYTDAAGGVCFLPCTVCADGFYIAKFRRKTK